MDIEIKDNRFSINLYDRKDYFNFSNIKAKIYYMINHIWFVRISCFIKKSEMYNVNINMIFYISYKEELLHRYFSSIWLRTPFSRTPLNGCFQNSSPEISNFLLRPVGLVKVICCKFLSLYDGHNTFQRDSTSSYSAISSCFFQF